MARSKKFKQNDNNLAIAYYRFSSHSQNDASIDQQKELAHAWADAHGLTIVKEYEDAAISGTKEDRPGFQLMLSEVAKIRPSTLIMWKTDRLGRDKYVLAMAKKEIRDAGCEIHLLAENIPTEGPEGILVEGLMDAMAEYYSRQLSQNIQRGMDYNAQHALFNGHKVWGYGVDRETKKYVVDEDTAPFVQRMFAEYAAGKAMQEICDEFNAQGLRTTRGAKFGVKTMNKMLQNRAYIGEYHHGDIVVPDGMPALIDTNTFDEVQARFALNKRKGSQRARGMDDAVTDRLVQLDEQKAALDETIKAEHVRAALFEDEHSIKAYFDKFMRADFDNPQTRDAVMEYFVDKIYLYDDKLVATFFYSEDRTEISWGELGDLVIDPFVKGEAAEFDVFPFGSTKDNQRPYLKGVLIYRDVFLMYNK